ncbi:MAG: DUF6263 family protein [Pirellulaceae bacterium]
MKLRKTWFVLAALFVCGSTATYGQVRLERKYIDDSTYKTETVSKLAQTLTMLGMTTDTTVDTRAVSVGKVGQRAADGTLKVKDHVQSLTVEMTIQGMKYSFDSQNPDNKGSSPFEMLRDVHKALAQKESTVIVDQHNRVTAVELDQSFLAGLPVNVQDLVKGQLDPENLKSVVNQEHDRLPSEPVRPGDTWVRTENMNLGAGQQMTFQMEYAYAGPVQQGDKSLDKITSKILSVAFTLQKGPIPLTLKGADLKAEKSEGTYLFDRQLGRIVDARWTGHLKGTLTFQANGMDIPSELDLTIETAVKEQ